MLFTENVIFVGKSGSLIDVQSLREKKRKVLVWFWVKRMAKQRGGFIGKSRAEEGRRRLQDEAALLIFLLLKSCPCLLGFRFFFLFTKISFSFVFLNLTEFSHS